MGIILVHLPVPFASFCHVQALFVSEKIWNLPTYTKALVDSLERDPLCLLHQGTAKEIRITAEDKRFATKVMQDSMQRTVTLFLS